MCSPLCTVCFGAANLAPSGLNDELSDDDAEQADDDEDATEEATEVSNPVTSGDVDEDCSMLELAVPSLLSIDSMRILPPYLHLVLGLTNNVVQQMLANLTSLGCVDPTVALRQFEHCALLAELEATVAAAVDELVELLKKEVKKQVTKVVSEMAKVPTPAAPDATSSGVAAPTGAEYVVPGEIAHADWNFLFQAAVEEVKRVRDVAEALAQVWLGTGSNRRPGDSDSDDSGDEKQPVQVSRKRQKVANKHGWYAEKKRAEAEVQVEEVEAAVASLRRAIVAFKAAEAEGCDDNSNIDEGFGVNALREAFNKFGISVQRYWNGAVSSSLP